MKRTAAAAATGAMLGLIGAKVALVGSGLVLIPWALIGVTIGVLSARRTTGDPNVHAIVDGAAFGAALSFAFLASGYDGDAGVGSVAVFVAFLTVFGAACGAILGVIGATLHRWQRRRAATGSDQRSGPAPS